MCESLHVNSSNMSDDEDDSDGDDEIFIKSDDVKQNNLSHLIVPFKELIARFLGVKLDNT